MESSIRKISALKHGMMNITAEGIVRRKSMLNKCAKEEVFLLLLIGQ